MQVYSLWSKEITSTFYYNNNGGSPIKSKVYRNASGQQVGSTISVPSDPSASGWTFKGWSTNESYTDLSSIYTRTQLTAPTESKNYYALHEKDVTIRRYQYNGKTDTQNGKAYRDYTNEEHGYKLTLSSLSGSSTPTNCSNLGWKKDSTSASKTYDVSVGSSVTLTSSANYYMLYKKTIYIQYYDNDGSALSTSVSNTSGTAYTNYNLSSSIAGKTPKLSSTLPTKSGYRFLGWATSSGQTKATYTKSDCTSQKAITGTTSDLQLYAVWEQKIATKDTPTSDFDANATVNFPTTAGISTWYPYAYDGTNYYVIAGQYYNPSQGLPSGLSKSSDSDFPYGVYMSSNTGNAPSGSEISTSGFWRRYDLSITAQASTRFCQRLLDTSFWKSKFSSTYTDDAIGSPTVEMLHMASNGRDGLTFSITKRSASDYSFDGSVGTKDKAFNIGQIRGQCIDYDLATPTADPIYILTLNSLDGRVWNTARAHTSESAGSGLRPVIKLNSRFRITQSGSSYIIQSN